MDPAVALVPRDGHVSCHLSRPNVAKAQSTTKCKERGNPYPIGIHDMCEKEDRHQPDEPPPLG